jgi:hypothetical protein
MRYDLGPIAQKLIYSLGEQQTEVLLDEIMPQLGCTSLNSPQIRYRFGELLSEKDAPGLRLLGHCIKAQAIMHGAKRV